MGSWLSCTLAMYVLSTATAAPASLTGTTLCLSATHTVMVSGVSGPEPYQMASQLYAEIKSLLRTRRVRFAEAATCRGSSADLTLALEVTPRMDGEMETRVSGRVDDRSRGGNSWLSLSELRWSHVEYGRAGTQRIEAQLLSDARTTLVHLVGAWTAANP